MRILELSFRDPEDGEQEDTQDLPTFDFDDPIIKGDQDIPDIR